MKHIFTLSRLMLVFALLLSANKAFPTILTVSNNIAISAQYSDIPTAIAAASSGDTIYIHGSNVNYGNITINKPLVLIGPGYGPTNPTGFAAQIGYLYLDTITGVSGASGTYIAGLYINYINMTGAYNSVALNNITIRRNQITGYLYIGYSNTQCHNWTISENLINSISYSIDQSNTSNILVNNNIISYMYNAYNSIYVNDIIYYNPTFSVCTVSNCIFIYSATNNSSSNSTFNNNLFSSAFNFTNGSNIFSPANQATTNSDPQFVGGTATTYLSISDYHLKTASAGHNAGTDATDLGVYGGTSFIWGGTPPVPMVYFYNLKPNYVQSNGNLNITVSVKNQ